MKNLYAICLLLFLSFSIAATAQTTSTGFKAGLNYSSWKGDAVNSLNDLTGFTNGYVTTSGKAGIYAGGFIDIPVAGGVSFEPGLYYSQKGYQLKGNLPIDKLDFLGATATATLQSYYIDMPLLMKAAIGKGLQVYAGPQVSYLVNSTLQVRAGALGFSVLNKKMDVTSGFNQFDIGITGGLGYQFDNGLFINAGYERGLSSLDKNGYSKSYNSTFKAGIGFKF